MITLISDHIARAKARLIEQYKGKTTVEGVVDSLVEEIQVLEDLFGQLNTDRALETASGVQLDGIGDIVGIEREAGQSDADYRISIKTKIIENISQGEPERVINVYRILVNATIVMLSDNYSGGVGLMSDVELTDQAMINTLFARIKRIVPAGIRVEYLGFFDTLADSFSFDGALAGKGFGSTTDPLAGGKFATIYIDKSKEFAFAGNDPKGGGFGTVHDPLIGGVMVGL